MSFSQSSRWYNHPSDCRIGDRLNDPHHFSPPPSPDGSVVLWVESCPERWRFERRWNGAPWVRVS